MRKIPSERQQLVGAAFASLCVVSHALSAFTAMLAKRMERHRLDAQHGVRDPPPALHGKELQGLLLKNYSGKEDGMQRDESGIWMVIVSGLCVGALLWVWADASFAQEQEVTAAGRKVYEQNCAVCHGREAKGDGVAMSLLTTKPADLTQIAKRNNGEFPFWKVYRVIDGREDIKGHGTRDMPIWGEEFRTQAGSSPTAESQVRGRILELVYYLQSIQAK